MQGFRVAVITLLTTASFVPMAAAAQSAASATGNALQAGPTAPSGPADASVQQAAEQSEVGEIIVTAQRREQTLERTPVSVAVVSADTLAKAQVVSEQDLRTNTPGLNIRATGNSNQINYVVRGESQDAFSDTRPGVMPYVNEVQVGGAGGTTAFYDLQSVQVLKGPQGTLFGRSATGGAVLFTTAKPTDQFSGFLSGTLGNYSAVKVEGAISGPIVKDHLSVRLAGIYQSRDGFQRNLFDGGREGDIDRKGLRASVSAEAGDLRNDLVVDYLRSTGSSTVAVISGINPSDPTNPNAPFVPGTILYGGTADPVAAATGAYVLSLATGAPLEFATAFYNGYFADPHHPNTGLLGVYADQQRRGPYVVDVDGRNEFRSSNILVTNTTALDLSDQLTLKNIFGFSRVKQTNFVDYDGTPYNFASQGPRSGATGPTGNRYDVRNLSDELQLSGKAIEDRLDYVAGLYFADERFKHRQNAYYFDIFFGGAYQLLSYDTETQTRAVYGQGTYKLTDGGLSFTLGGRYTSERVRSITQPDATTRLALGDPAPPGYSYRLQDTFNNVSWRVGLQQQVDPSFMLYGSVARAYRTGGFNGTPAPKVGFAETGGVEYREERVTAAELGAKFAGQVAGLPARANLAAYYSWVRNNQRVAYTVIAGSPAGLTATVPKAELYGVEFDGFVRPARWLTLGALGTYIHSRFGADTVFLNGAPAVFDQVPDTPNFTGTLYTDLRAPLTGSIGLLGHADYYLQSKSNTSPQSTNNFGTKIPSYGLLNLRLGIENEAAGWSLTANLKNVTDKVYYVGGIPNGVVYGVNALVPGDPRTFTIEARIKF